MSKVRVLTELSRREPNQAFRVGEYTEVKTISEIGVYDLAIGVLGVI